MNPSEFNVSAHVEALRSPAGAKRLRGIERGYREKLRERIAAMKWLEPEKVEKRKGFEDYLRRLGG